MTATAAKSTPENAADMGELYDRASLAFAPFAAAVLVAGADGKLEGKEAEALMAGLRALRSPILQKAVMDGSSPAEKLVRLLQNPMLARITLLNTGAKLRTMPGGSAARAELVALATRIAEANAKRTGFLGLFGDKVIRADEQAALDDLRALLA